MMKASEFVEKLCLTVKALVKVMVSSRPQHRPLQRDDLDELIILANGPSLRSVLEERGAELAQRETMCVNFMANTPSFNEIRPRYYVLADPHFFNGTSHADVASLWRNIAAVSWKMTLMVPARFYSKAQTLLGDSMVLLTAFNDVGVESFACIERFLFNHRLAMPRPRNVLIPSLMLAIWSGAKRIYVAGADHSWLETIHVDEENHVVSIQPHFYADSKAEKQRTTSEYQGYRLHDILYSFYVAFHSYHTVARYAGNCGVEIFNSTPGSFIDAFPRKPF